MVTEPRPEPASDGSYTRSRAWVLGLVLVAVLVITGAVAVVMSQSSDDDAVCDALMAPVPGITHIDWDNGITSVGGGGWFFVLTDGVEHGDAASRAAIAEAVAADAAGYQQLLEAFDDPGDRATLDELHRVALDASAPNDGFATAASLNRLQEINREHDCMIF